ncbi:transmembrane protein, putative (macronuclear) [Tetrahymena thermophila SB210]|uniref:Transmembrane protein, putative n=1 Tax=Tetrahymena thermophila (strain SB210) TaxID=312017 RepID=I7M8U7_TETTS|nr:transmembrane protein, putative [Tetrahymena thermophila SB210]EAR99698.1 transmembrane protein, putative [Tetrahymena thermophila SB210]|eukprot:XP_001019943.1 transmembrane protein, putative [Tetrahymena thermophila SB210]
MQLIKFIQFTSLLLLGLVVCQSSTSSTSGGTPSWATAQQAQNYMNCSQKLMSPTCASGQSPTCTQAISTYVSCITCSSNNSSYSAFKSCVQKCGSDFTSDPTAQNDSTVATFVNGMNQCVAAAYSTLFALSTILLLMFTLI